MAEPGIQQVTDPPPDGTPLVVVSPLPPGTGVQLNPNCTHVRIHNPTNLNALIRFRCQRAGHAPEYFDFPVDAHANPWPIYYIPQNWRPPNQARVDVINLSGPGGAVVDAYQYP